jgi:hypothetical protein
MRKVAGNKELGCTLPEVKHEIGLSAGAGGPVGEHPDAEIIRTRSHARGASRLTNGDLGTADGRRDLVNGYRTGKEKTAERRSSTRCPKFAIRRSSFLAVRAVLSGGTRELGRQAVELYTRGLSTRNRGCVHQ